MKRVIAWVRNVNDLRGYENEINFILRQVVIGARFTSSKTINFATTDNLKSMKTTPITKTHG